MITFSRLGRWGRLGNQMFEYAALLGIGMRLGYDVAVPGPDRHDLASCFDITARILTGGDRGQLRHVFQEPRIGYSERFWAIEDFTDLRGFFQSPRYFPPRDVVKAEFTFRADLMEAAADVMQPWRDEGRVIVGMTVRRSDYQEHPELYVQLWDTDFYDRALAEFEDLDPIVVVSSDDQVWCRERFAGERFVFADTVSDNAQLALLTLCDHLIVSNSSYAWWSAWLNDGPGRRIAASRWLGEGLETHRDPLPEGWEALEV
jgi:glycosyl transferase family 11